MPLGLGGCCWDKASAWQACWAPPWLDLWGRGCSSAACPIRPSQRTHGSRICPSGKGRSSPSCMNQLGSDCGAFQLLAFKGTCPFHPLCCHSAARRLSRKEGGFVDKIWGLRENKSRGWNGFLSSSFFFSFFGYKEKCRVKKNVCRVGTCLMWNSAPQTHCSPSSTPSCLPQPGPAGAAEQLREHISPAPAAGSPQGWSLNLPRNQTLMALSDARSELTHAHGSCSQLPRGMELWLKPFGPAGI